MRFDEQQLAVARIYAHALYGLADSMGQAESVREELDSLDTLLDAQPDLVAVFDSPLVGADRRADLLEKSFRGQLSDLVVDTLQVMNRKGRLGIAAALVEAYRQEDDRINGRIQATVTTAVPLSAELRARVESAVLTIGRRLASADDLEVRSVELIEEVDESLLGGMVVRGGVRVFDSSVRSEVALVGERLADRTSVEVLRRGSAYIEDEDAG